MSGRSLEGRGPVTVTLRDVWLNSNHTEILRAKLRFYGIREENQRPADWSAVFRHVNRCRAEEVRGLQDRRPSTYVPHSVIQRRIHELTRRYTVQQDAWLRPDKNFGLWYVERLTRRCATCSEQFYCCGSVQRAAHAVYCSPKCKPRKFKSRAKPRPHLVCTNCGETFVARTGARTCSTKCRMALHRERLRAPAGLMSARR